MDDLPASECERAFPFHMLIDGEGRLLALGEALRRTCPGVHVGDNLLQHVIIERPLRAALDWRQIAHRPDSQFSVAFVDYDLRLEGPMVPVNGRVAFLASS